jgi:thiol-disulfide isomerase/thioredoxin
VLALATRLCLLLALAPLQVGDAAPEPIEIDALDGSRARLEFTGRLTLVDFFATWCPKCRQSVASYEKLLGEHGAELRIVLVDVEEHPAVVRRFFRHYPLPAGVLVTLDPTGAVFRGFGATAFPTFVLIDDKGVVRKVSSGWGEGSADAMSRWVADVLRKPRAPRRGSNKHAPTPAAPRAESEDSHARRLGVQVLR